LSTGDPLIDIAIVYTALVGYKVADPGNDFIPMPIEETIKLWKLFVKEYCKSEPDKTAEDVEKWCKRFCYLRLFRRGVRKETASPWFAENSKKALTEVFS